MIKPHKHITRFEMAERLTPRLCWSCGKAVSSPLKSFRLLHCLHGGGKGKGSDFTATTISERLGITREYGRQLIEQALKYKLIEPMIRGGLVYKRTHYGMSLYSRWKSVGFEFEKRMK
jgi:hypothetical protein